MLNFLLFLLCATVSAGETGENCHECSGTAWNNCVGQEYVCRASEKCISAAAEITQELAGQGKVSINKVIRKCGDIALCNEDFSVNFRVASWKIKAQCGSNATLGKENASKGKLTCYGCISEPHHCTKTVQCSKTETMCISASETVAGKLVVNRGCATKSMCNLRESISEVMGPTVVGHVSCCLGNLCNSSGVLKSTSSLCFLLLSILSWMLP